VNFVGDILQPTHLLFILVIALLVLGPKRIPEVGRSLGKGIRDFRKAISLDDDTRDMLDVRQSIVDATAPITTPIATPVPPAAPIATPAEPPAAPLATADPPTMPFVTADPPTMPFVTADPPTTPLASAGPPIMPLVTPASPAAQTPPTEPTPPQS
jgi:TatA/E family protein of Tat protein translocase